jgi:thiamine pyrophosphokinase
MDKSSPEQGQTLDDYLQRYVHCDRITLLGPMLQQRIRQDDPLILVDGGSNFREGEAGFAVGDGDSSREQLDQFLNPDKDFSDLAYVLGRLPANFREVKLLGFLGGRRDHELFNLGEVHHYLDRAEAPTRVDLDDAVSACSAGQWQFDIEGTFSLAVLAPARVTLLGRCQYHIAEPELMRPLSSFGLSNHGYGTIEVECDGPLFLFHPDDHHS